MIEKVSQIALTYFSQLLYKVTRVSSAYETKDLKKSHVNFFHRTFLRNNMDLNNCYGFNISRL